MNLTSLFFISLKENLGIIDLQCCRFCRLLSELLIQISILHDNIQWMGVEYIKYCNQCHVVFDVMCTKKNHEANDNGHNLDFAILALLHVSYPMRSGCKEKKHPSSTSLPYVDFREETRIVSLVSR